MRHERYITINRQSVNAETGEFEAVLFTDGEASDGHILNIPGGEIPERMPLFVNHAADPRTQLGSLEPVMRDKHKVVVKGRILTQGSGSEADIRRDILLKMASGHVSQVSGRWDADPADVVRRMDLPKDHFAYISADAEGPRRFGLFFEKWRALEGSIVGLGADPQAVIRWATDATSPETVREFWARQLELEEDDPDDLDLDQSFDSQEREDDRTPLEVVADGVEAHEHFVRTMVSEAPRLFDEVMDRMERRVLRQAAAMLELATGRPVRPRRLQR